MYKTITNCRACNGTDLVEVFNFGRPFPLANDFVKPGAEHQGFAPLRVLYCKTCTLAQLGEVVDPAIIYRNYPYATSKSPMMARHFDRLFKDIASESGKGKLLEIASNDGTCLAFAKTKGFEVRGFDPALNLCVEAEKAAVPTVPEFFTKETAGLVLSSFGTPNIILARHVFAHMDNWTSFIAGLALISNAETLIALEFPYVKDTLDKGQWDVIYHEHLSCVGLKPIVAALNGTPFHVHAVLKYGVLGGSVLVMLRHNDSGITPHLSADEMLAEENVTAADWELFAAKAKDRIARLRELVGNLTSAGKIVCAYGASAKATVLINACGFDVDQLQFVTDGAPLKIGRLIPGTSIPVMDKSEMLSRHPDYAIMSAWNYRLEILEETAEWRRRGGKFVVPNQDLEIV